MSPRSQRDVCSISSFSQNAEPKPTRHTHALVCVVSPSTRETHVRHRLHTDSPSISPAAMEKDRRWNIRLVGRTVVLREGERIKNEETESMDCSPVRVEFFPRLLEAESAQLNYIPSWQCKKCGANKPAQKFPPFIEHGHSMRQFCEQKSGALIWNAIFGICHRQI